MLLPFADNALCAANVRYGSKSRHNTAGENVRFDMSIAQSSRSGIGPIEPNDECPVFGLAVAELTVANPP